MKIIQPPSGGMPRDWQMYFEELTKQLQQLADRTSPRNNTTFTTTNVTPDFSFDADSTTTAELADVLGTLIDALKRNRTIN